MPERDALLHLGKRFFEKQEQGEGYISSKILTALARDSCP